MAPPKTMDSRYRNLANGILITGGLGVVLGLVPGVLPAWFAHNAFFIVGSGGLIVLLLIWLNLPTYRRRKQIDSDMLVKTFFCGRKREREEILDRLKDKAVPVLNLWGLGGVGKTSLIREVIEENKIFDSIVWQTAKKQFMDQGQLRQRESSESVTFESLCNKIALHFGVLIEYKALKKTHERIQLIEGLLKRHTTLLIIDNFETIDQNFDAFIKSLTDVIAETSSKAILTCRFRLETAASYKLDGLTLEETAELLNHELSIDGKGSKLSAEKVRNVHEATNGLPLAIKLIAAQAKTIHVAALDEILERLSAIDFTDPAEVYDRFYKFIYREIWKGLPKDAKKLLITLSTFSMDERITYENLQVAFLADDHPSNKEKDRFEKAFSQNIKFALLESKEINNQHSFFIHPLTKTFVRAELLKEAR